LEEGCCVAIFLHLGRGKMGDDMERMQWEKEGKEMGSAFIWCFDRLSKPGFSFVLDSRPAATDEETHGLRLSLPCVVRSH
jgi:hypothetical protein